MTERQQDLLELIRQAFRGVKLGEGVSMHETIVIDMYGSAKERQAARAADEKHDWSKLIDDPELANIGGIGGLSFYDAVGLRFHLPAYLSLAVKGPKCEAEASLLSSLLYHLTHLDEVNRYNLMRFSILDDAQRRCVREFLIHLRDVVEIEDSDLNRVIEGYWNARGQA